MSFMDEFDWLLDLKRRAEVQEWASSFGIDMQEFVEWARDHQVHERTEVQDGEKVEVFSDATFPLDLLKDSTEGYDLNAVVSWAFHYEDGIVVQKVQKRLPPYRELAEAHNGSLEFIGIDDQGIVHVAYAGKCGECKLLEKNTLDNLKKELLTIEGVTDVVNDGKVSLEREDNSLGAYENGEVPITIQSRTITQ